MSAYEERKAILTIKMVPQNAHTTGQLRGWLLIETDARSGAPPIVFSTRPPMVPIDPRLSGIRYWVKIELLVTSIFICPDRPIKTALLPLEEKVVTWTVVNVGSQDVIVLPRSFTVRLHQFGKNRNGAVIEEPIVSRVVDNERIFGNCLQVSPASAVVGSDSRRRFRAIIRYPSEQLRVDEASLYVSAFEFRPVLSYSMSILTREQWLAGINFKNSKDSRDLSLETAFLPGAADATQSFMQTRTKEGFINDPIYVNVVLGDIFGNTPAQAIMGTKPPPSISKRLPFLSVLVTPIAETSVDLNMPLGIANGDIVESFSFSVTFDVIGKAQVDVRLGNSSISASPITLRKSRRLSPKRTAQRRRL